MTQSDLTSHTEEETGADLTGGRELETDLSAGGEDETRAAADIWRRDQKRTPSGQCGYADSKLPLEAEWVSVSKRVVAYVRIQIKVTAFEADRILADKPLEVRMVVARPTVTPTARYREKSSSSGMRVSAGRARGWPITETT
jgi:hypothetical protein